jgi:hypothetical protein
MTATLDNAVADLQRANAELQRQLESCAERDEALARETATAEVLQIINSSPGDLAPVFDAMLEKATTLYDAVFGQLLTYDGERFQVTALRGIPQFASLAWGRGPFRPWSGSALDRVAQGESHVHIHDVVGDIACGPSSDASAIRSSFSSPSACR